MLCQDCRKRPTCKKPCPALERDLRRFTKAQREKPLAGVRDRQTATMNLRMDNIQQVISWRLLGIGDNYFTLDGGDINFPRLTRLQNQCIQLFYFEGKSYRKIARALSGGRGKIRLNESQVRYQLHRAKKLLRKHFF